VSGAELAASIYEQAVCLRAEVLVGAEFARRVTMVVRGDSLAKSMSHYLVERIEAHPRIAVRTRSRVIAARGDDRLETVLIADDPREAGAGGPT
jgi:thioredoxin reductase